MVAHGVGVPSDQIMSELSRFRDRAPLIKSDGREPTPLRVLRPVPTVKTISGKGLGHIEIYLVFHDKVTDSAQLARHRCGSSSWLSGTLSM